MMKFLRLIALFILVAIAFVGYNSYKMAGNVMTGQGQSQSLQTPEGQAEIIKYGRKAMATTMEVAAPILDKVGVDVKGKFTEESDEVTRRVEEASKMLEAANKALK